MTNVTPLFGYDLFGDPVVPQASGLMAERFMVPPFTVLNAREGDWQARKAAWISLGIRSELGRAEMQTMYATSQGSAEGLAARTAGMTGTSVFDPVLCELAYRWFSPAGGQVLDPFAGGSVRGVVAAHLGRRYWGCDLSDPQVQANREQAAAIVPGRPCEWVVGDAIDCVPTGPEADFVFTCPPYGDLERYSDDPRDISTMDYHAFVSALSRVIFLAVQRLKRDRFAAIVVGDFRDPKTGAYRNFPSHTITAFLAAGAVLYNECVLVTPCGTLPLRAAKSFTATRKLGKGHQNLLVFCKGDPRRAAAAVGDVVFGMEG